MRVLIKKHQTGYNLAAVGLNLSLTTELNLIESIKSFEEKVAKSTSIAVAKQASTIDYYKHVKYLIPANGKLRNNGPQG